MANRYWVGGTGAWDSSNTTNWSASSGGAGGASIPTSSDAAIFDASSGAGVCTASSRNCLTLVCTGYTGTLTDQVNVFGTAITLSSGGTYTGLTIVAGASCTFTSAGKTIASLIVDTGTVTVTCADAMSATSAEIKNAGTLLLKNGVTSTINTLTTTTGVANRNLRSTVGGSQATLTGSGITNTLQNITVQDTAFTGTNIWRAGGNFVNNGNVTGIISSLASLAILELF